MSKLVIRSGPQAGIEFPLDRPTIRLGRGSRCDVMLQSTQCSREHAQISQQGGQLFIQDLGSTNGTFVNNQQVTAPRPLQPGDQVRIGDVILAYEMGPVAAAPAMGAAAATDWEAELWDDEYTKAGPADKGRNTLVWVMGGIVAVLLVAIGIGAVLVLRGDDGTATPVAEVTTAPTSAIVVAPTAPQAQETTSAQPTDAPLIDVPTVAMVVPTVEVKVPVPDVKLPADLPVPLPVAPENLEELPVALQQFLGDVPPEQLPQILSEQIELLGPEQTQIMIASLFPGVDPAQLPQVVAASFPDLPQGQIEALLAQAFPGMDFQLPDMSGPVGGRLALGMWKDSEDDYGLYIANAMGGQPTQVVEFGSAPSFSRDGQWLVYHQGHPDRLGLRLIKPDGSGDTPLTTFWTDYNPHFSPDGQRVLFFNFEHKTLHLINRDGTNRRDIGTGEYPAWSPKGDKIIYRGCIGGGKCGLIVANADGSNPTRITTHANDAAPRWSPNGGQVVFHSDRDGNWEIYVINVDGSWLRRITLNPTTDMNPVWSPDGLRIAFRSDRGGKWGVWATSGVGGGANKLFDAGFAGDHWLWGQMDWGK